MKSRNFFAISLVCLKRRQNMSAGPTWHQSFPDIHHPLPRSGMSLTCSPAHGLRTAGSGDQDSGCSLLSIWPSNIRTCRMLKQIRHIHLRCFRTENKLDPRENTSTEKRWKRAGCVHAWEWGLPCPHVIEFVHPWVVRGTAINFCGELWQTRSAWQTLVFVKGEALTYLRS